MSTRFIVYWFAEDGSREYPGCSEAEATFASLEEAEAAIESLRETDPEIWAEADLRIEEARS